MADSALQDISRQLSEDFTEETINQLKQDLFKQKNLVQEIYNTLLALEKPGKTDLSLLRNAYRSIMAARNFFTGEEIDYRIYYSSSDDDNFFKNVGIYTLSEQEVLNLTYVEGNSLRLKNTFDEALEIAHQNTEREEIFRHHWLNIVVGFVQAEWSVQTVYRVHKRIYDEYIGRNPQLWNTKYKRYNTFNRGNIYEAFEATAQDVYNPQDGQDKFIYKSELFRDKYFGTYLKHDVVKGFQTGDVDLIQIKARSAALIEVKTLKIYLKQILDILNSNNLSKKQLKAEIRKLFTDPEIEELDEALNQYIDKKVDDLLLCLS